MSTRKIRLTKERVLKGTRLLIVFLLVLGTEQCYSQSAMVEQKATIVGDTIYADGKPIGLFQMKDSIQVVVFSSKKNKSKFEKQIEENVSTKLLCKYEVNENVLLPSIRFVENRIMIKEDTIGFVKTTEYVASVGVVATITTRSVDNTMYSYIESQMEQFYKGVFKGQRIKTYIDNDFRNEDESLKAFRASQAEKVLEEKRRSENKKSKDLSFPNNFENGKQDKQHYEHKNFMNKALVAYNDFDRYKTRYYLEQAELTKVTSGDYYWLLGLWYYNIGDKFNAAKSWNKGYEIGCFECSELEYKARTNSLGPILWP